MSYDDPPRLFGYIPMKTESTPGTSRVHTWTLPTSGIMYASDHADSQRRRITSTLRSRNNKAHRQRYQAWNTPAHATPLADLAPIIAYMREHGRPI